MTREELDGLIGDFVTACASVASGRRDVDLRVTQGRKSTALDALFLRLAAAEAVLEAADTLRKLHGIDGCDCAAEPCSHSIGWGRYDAARAAHLAAKGGAP